MSLLPSRGNLPFPFVFVVFFLFLLYAVSVLGNSEKRHAKKRYGGFPIVPLAL